jgi:hypothetical protein
MRRGAAEREKICKAGEKVETGSEGERGRSREVRE